VTPTHVVPQILEALEIAARGGFALPLVYNTGGYDKVEVLRLLDGIVDIYMPDLKFLSGEAAERFTGAADYPDVVRGAAREMHRQVGDLIISNEGIAERGLLVRHLVMPGMLDDTRRVVEFIANELSPNTYVNVMRQYRPEYKACDFPPLDEPLTREDWREAIAIAHEAGLGRLDEV
jgi:putative pyruvate formate lyase activating enzyme